MATNKRLNVEKHTGFFIIEYGDVGLEAKHLGQGMYYVDAYDIESGMGGIGTRSSNINDDPLEVILASSESRKVDMWWPLNDYYGCLNSTECDELDVVVEDILAGHYDPKPKQEPKPEPEGTIPNGVNPNQGILDTERKKFRDTWMNRLRYNK